MVTSLKLLKTNKENLLICQVTLYGTPREAPGLAIKLDSALSDYFSGLAANLSGFPLDLEGFTPFRKAVTEVVQAIPAGQTLTYGEVAERAGRPGAARAVGQVLARNPFALLVPCHRVLGAKGELGGFSAGGPEVKARLLELERAGRAVIMSLDVAIAGPGWGCMDGEHH
jgi:methylated-DNA-[protein]-cysteine S-methyltransferase